MGFIGGHTIFRELTPQRPHKAEDLSIAGSAASRFRRVGTQPAPQASTSLPGPEPVPAWGRLRAGAKNPDFINETSASW